ncbi:MAG: enoyl-CoA hydratase-related protein [Dehalococcoidia bacterium]
MDYTQLTYEVKNRVAHVTLNRPEYRNPIGRITVEELDDAFRRAVNDSDVGVVLLAANGRHFSAGHDLGTPAKIADDEQRPYRPGARGQFERSWELYIDPGLRWRNLPKPTIAAVQGYCIWGGWMVATAMDMVFATEDAKFLGSKFQYFSVPWDIGIRKAKEVLFETRFVSAHEAQQLGFVGRVYASHEELLAEATSYAERVAENDEFQLRMMKLAINQAQDAQGYSNNIVTAHNMQGGGDGKQSQGFQLPSGERRVAPIDRALTNLGLTHGLLP